MSFDLRLAGICLDFLERVYDWEKGDAPWLKSVVEAVWEFWGRPEWSFGLFYDASDVTAFRYSNLVFAGASPQVREFTPRMLSMMHPAYVRGTFRTLTAGFGRAVAEGEETGWQEVARHGASDVFGINGIDPSGTGCMIALAVSRPAASADLMQLSHRLAAHLASAYRCRRRIRSESAPLLDSGEAIIGLEGRLLDARGPAAEPSARRGLEEAARQIREVRAHSDQGQPLEGWRPQVRGRWTFVDAPSTDGLSYLVARENVARADGLLSLTEREQQVVFGAAVGKSNKEIAYEMGITASTARVLLARAYSRLKVRSRQELLALPSVRALRGQEA